MTDAAENVVCKYFLLERGVYGVTVHVCVHTFVHDMVLQKWGARIYFVSPPRHTQRGRGPERSWTSPEMEASRGHRPSDSVLFVIKGIMTLISLSDREWVSPDWVPQLLASLSLGGIWT